MTQRKFPESHRDFKDWAHQEPYAHGDVVSYKGDLHVAVEEGQRLLEKPSRLLRLAARFKHTLRTVIACSKQLCIAHRTEEKNP